MALIQATRGTKDILPQEVGYWQLVEQTATEIFSRALYQEIRPPLFEQTSLFARGIGEGTDVGGKEM
jgi:histidyl-tRNA synthetase